MSARFRTPEHLWYGRDVSASVAGARSLLTPLSWLYAGAASAHQGLYRSGILKVHKAPVPVVAVGNVVVGGAGKTPVVMALATLALRNGMRPAVLSRGYGETLPREGVIVTSASEIGGDEPRLIASRVAGVHVLAGADRVHLARRAVDELGANLLILDDGMQHHRLFHDALIAVVRMPSPVGNGLHLPAGPLRQGPRALKAAHSVVVIGPSTPELGPLQIPPEKLLFARLEPSRLVELNGPELPLSSLRGRRILAAAAIGRPQSFAETLERCGATVAELVALPDHATPDLAQLGERARHHGASSVVITEKDATKLTHAKPEVPIHVLQVDLEFSQPDASSRLSTLLLELGAARVVS